LPRVIASRRPSKYDAASNTPCWHVISVPVKCTKQPQLILKIEDPVAQPDGTQVVADCVTDA